MKINFKMISTEDYIQESVDFLNKHSPGDIPVIVEKYKREMDGVSVTSAEYLVPALEHISRRILDIDFDYEDRPPDNASFSSNKAYYVVWMAKNLGSEDGGVNWEDLSMLYDNFDFMEGYHSLLTTLHAHIGINNLIELTGSTVWYLELDDVVERIENYIQEHQGKKKEDKRFVRSEDLIKKYSTLPHANLLYNNSGFLITQVLSLEAARYWSQVKVGDKNNPSNGSWCTGWLENDYYYKDYIDDGLIFVIQDKLGSILGDSKEAKYQCFLPSNKKTDRQELKDYFNGEVSKSLSNNLDLLTALSDSTTKLKKTDGVTREETLTAYIARYNKNVVKDKQYFCIEDFFFARNCVPVVNDQAKKIIDTKGAALGLKTFGVGYIKTNLEGKAFLHLVSSKNKFAQHVARSLATKLDLSAMAEDKTNAKTLREMCGYLISGQDLLNANGLNIEDISRTQLHLKDKLGELSGSIHNFITHKSENPHTKESDALFLMEAVIAFMDKLHKEDKDALVEFINKLYKRQTLHIILAVADKKNLDKIVFYMNQVPDVTSNRAKVKLSFQRNLPLIETAKSLAHPRYSDRVTNFPIAYWTLLLDNKQKLAEDKASLSAINKLLKEDFESVLYATEFHLGRFNSDDLQDHDGYIIDHDSMAEIIRLLSRFRQVLTPEYFSDLIHKSMPRQTYDGSVTSWISYFLSERGGADDVVKNLNIYDHLLETLNGLADDIGTKANILDSYEMGIFINPLDRTVGSIKDRIRKTRDQDPFGEKELKLIAKYEKVLTKIKTIKTNYYRMLVNVYTKERILKNKEILSKNIQSPFEDKAISFEKINPKLKTFFKKLAISSKDILDGLFTPYDKKLLAMYIVLNGPKVQAEINISSFKRVSILPGNNPEILELSKTIPQGMVEDYLDKVIQAPDINHISVNTVDRDYAELGLGVRPNQTNLLRGDNIEIAMAVTDWNLLFEYASRRQPSCLITLFKEASNSIEYFDKSVIEPKLLDTVNHILSQTPDNRKHLMLVALVAYWAVMHPDTQNSRTQKLLGSEDVLNSIMSGSAIVLEPESRLLSDLSVFDSKESIKPFLSKLTDLSTPAGTIHAGVTFRLCLNLVKVSKLIQRKGSLSKIPKAYFNHPTKLTKTRNFWIDVAVYLRRVAPFLFEHLDTGINTSAASVLFGQGSSSSLLHDSSSQVHQLAGLTLALGLMTNDTKLDSAFSLTRSKAIELTNNQ